MNWLLLSSLLALALGILAEERYNDRYDNVNLDEIMTNKRLFDSYVKCILDKGRCTSEGKELKLHIKDAMETGCSKCTETQRHGARKIVRFIRANELDVFEQIKKKYDPNNKYEETYEAFLAADD